MRWDTVCAVEYSVKLHDFNDSSLVFYTLNGSTVQNSAAQYSTISFLNSDTSPQERMSKKRQVESSDPVPKA